MAGHCFVKRSCSGYSTFPAFKGWLLDFYSRFLLFSISSLPSVFPMKYYIVYLACLKAASSLRLFIHLACP
ncbi:hypothetical protein BDV28DRAFT_138772 [Aspergillus coremiiformis]|uniref:Uncharacterized protein n=1 Tax=Aspergillus coremiiformis TaxID=138285 RepID=A0A5N6Z3Q2_9EURO|nr:hypothetical protein BDV28DRAFT_138772 [Aspergillus coremiiformis]